MEDVAHLIAMQDKYAALHPEHVWDENVSGWFIKQFDEKTAVWVTPLMFTFAVIVGPPGEPFYEDRWCYASSDAAINAAVAWEGPYPGTEPYGWHRHPTSGRRRENGDQACEYVAM